THGRAPRGGRVKAAVPGSWQQVTLIAGLRLSGVVAPLALEGATDQWVFQAHVQQALAPRLRPGGGVVWDNWSAHQAPAAAAAIKAVGARVEPLPTYSPDLTPIEEMFSKTKGYLRAAARATNTVIAALGSVLNQVTLSNILGWFHDRCVYAFPE